jgi:hypothetical protein
MQMAAAASQGFPASQGDLCIHLFPSDKNIIGLVRVEWSQGLDGMDMLYAYRTKLWIKMPEQQPESP